MIDCHVHTALCGHAQGDAAAYAEAARMSGISVLAFTEHLPLPKRMDPLRSYSMAPSDLEGYVADVLGLRESFSETQILLGAEADWLPDDSRDLAELLGSFHFDVVLGSVHFLDGWAFDDPDKRAEWDGRDVDAVWRLYFQRVCDAAASGLFDVIAHPDLVKKFGHRPSFDQRELFEEVAGCFSKAGVAIEVSTAGLRKPVGELYPSEELLLACRRAGVPATMGSDAHKPSEVGYRLPDAVEAIRQAGYKSIVYFLGREPREVAL